MSGLGGRRLVNTLQIAVWLGFAAAMSLASPRLASADGPGTGGRRVRLDSEPVGPYLVRVVTSPDPPKVGELFVEVRLFDPNSGSTITDAEVLLGASPLSEDAPSVRTRARHEIAPIATDFAGHLPVSNQGDWRISVFIDGPLGPAETSFLERVSQPSSLAPLISAGLPFAGLALLILIFLWLQREQQGSRS